MSIFIGRKSELNLLRSLFNKPSASLIVIKGRRRIGKSRLLEEFGKFFTKTYTLSGLPPMKDTAAKSQINEIAKQFTRQKKQRIKSTNQINSDWSELFWQIAKNTQQGRVLVILDEIYYPFTMELGVCSLPSDSAGLAPGCKVWQALCYTISARA